MITPAGSSPTLRGNRAGVVSLVAAILLFLWQVASQFLWPLIPSLTERIDLPY